MRYATLFLLLTAGVAQAQQPYTPTPLQPQYPGQFGPPWTTTPKPGAWQDTPTTTQPAPSTTSQPATPQGEHSAFYGFLIIAGLVAVIVWALSRPRIYLRGPFPPMPPRQQPSAAIGWLLVGAGILVFYLLTR